MSEVLYISAISSFVQFVLGAFALRALSKTNDWPVGGRILWVAGYTGVSSTVLKERTMWWTRRGPARRPFARRSTA